MPLDTSTYALSLLRLDGRRWNELRRLHAQISTQAAADGSSYLEMGNTKVLCTVTGPAEGPRTTGAAGGGGKETDARIEVDVGFVGFSGVERRRRRLDKYVRFCFSAQLGEFGIELRCWTDWMLDRRRTNANAQK